MIARSLARLFLSLSITLGPFFVTRGDAAPRSATARRAETLQNIHSEKPFPGEHPEVRRIAIEALGGRSGAVVVINPRSGRIYTVVNQEWAARGGFKPCSTIKLITAAAALNEGIIEKGQLGAILDKEEATADSKIQLSALSYSLAKSENSFFQRVGYTIGYDRMIHYASAFGFGRSTGSNYPGEIPGRLPSRSSGPGSTRVFSHADGFEVTPLQLAVAVSSIANGGSLMKPKVPEPGKPFAPEVASKLGLPLSTLGALIPGMVGAVEYGTARKAKGANLTLAGKTGTCVQDGEWLGLFASYAPVYDPQLAIVVVSRGEDGRYGGPVRVAGHIYRSLVGKLGRSLKKESSNGHGLALDGSDTIALPADRPSTRPTEIHVIQGPGQQRPRSILMTSP